MEPDPMLLITADRDSVSAGDDCESHERPFFAGARASVLELLRLAMEACGLPVVAGGNATWMVEVGGYGGKPIAVAAQQWDEPRLLVPSSETVESLLREHEPRLFFRYWCQADPGAVFHALAAGAALPDRHA